MHDNAARAGQSGGGKTRLISIGNKLRGKDRFFVLPCRHQLLPGAALELEGTRPGNNRQMGHVPSRSVCAGDYLRPCYGIECYGIILRIIFYKQIACLKTITSLFETISAL